MKFTEYCDIINCNIKITYYHNQKNRWSAAIEYADTKKTTSSGVLEGTYGNGKNPEEAISDYIEKISGKLLVLNAMSKENRREYKVPLGLEV